MNDSSEYVIVDRPVSEHVTGCGAVKDSEQTSADAISFVSGKKQPLLPDVGVIALVPDAWDALWQPRHHVLSRLARYFNVVWVEPSENWRTALSGRSDSWARRDRPDFSEPSGLHVYAPEVSLPRFHAWRWLDSLLMQQRVRRARKLLARQGCQKVILYLWRPAFLAALGGGPFDLSCYHIDDEYTFSPIDLPISESEHQLISAVDQVIVHSQGLLDKKGRINPHTAFVPNGVDYQAYSILSPEPQDLATIPHPRIGYTGFLKRHLDWSALSLLAQEHPEWSFVFVGPLSPHRDIAPQIQAMSKRENVHFLGPKPTELLCAYPQHFDVCIMPYQSNDYARYVYPLKLHEYLATGRPTVGTRIRTLAEFPDVVALARTPEEWSEAIKNSLNPIENTPARRNARQEVARQFDWQGLVRQIAEIMTQRLGKDYASRLSELLLSGRRSVDLSGYRSSSREKERVGDLLEVVPKGHSSILDIGGRDGYISDLLTAHFDSVTCLDLEKPQPKNKTVASVSGDVTKLKYPDNTFDVTICAEVLEHIPPQLLSQACSEIARVTKHAVVVGVPYEQDRRVGRTTCRFCGEKNPCWGHINEFNEARLKELFKTLTPVKTTFVGKTKDRTNRLSVTLMDLGENPWGTYEQEESCLYCGGQLIPPVDRRWFQRICSGLATLLTLLQSLFVSEHPIWVHMIFRKDAPEHRRPL